MTHPVPADDPSRRRFLQTVAAGTAVVAVDPTVWAADPPPG